MNGLELFRLGRALMKIGEQATPSASIVELPESARLIMKLPTSVRLIMGDVFEHPDSSIGEITARTGYPQSHVSASVARLKEDGLLELTVDPKDRRRTLARASFNAPREAGQLASVSIDNALAAALGAEDHREIKEIIATLEALAQRLAEGGVRR